jgi:hypothetical protein
LRRVVAIAWSRADDSGVGQAIAEPDADRRGVGVERDDSQIAGARQGSTDPPRRLDWRAPP